jgi:hypothetical protein
VKVDSPVRGHLIFEKDAPGTGLILLSNERNGFWEVMRHLCPMPLQIDGINGEHFHVLLAGHKDHSRETVIHGK